MSTRRATITIEVSVDDAEGTVTDEMMQEAVGEAVDALADIAHVAKTEIMHPLAERIIEPVTRTPRTGYATDPGDRDETHPAFGVAAVSRGSGTPRPLFQTDLQHSEVMRLTIHRAVRTRSLHRDWTHPTQELIEVEMSLSQWGALVSSVGIGSGVPVTIRRTENDIRVPDLPYEPRIAESVGEAKATVRRLLEKSMVTLGELEHAVEEKRGIRATREALNSHRLTLEHASGNAAFAIKSVTEAAEKVTTQARADIEAHILDAVRLTGATPIEAPTLDIGEIEAARDD
ncbi:hypothetical protein QDA00_gp30 [Microbacterium phage Matzah]|uniref:Uncharacterized protein n=1 Tax=Microbacterium phage Matzah TaxID=2686228 RepID=A0A6B9L8Y3_9CAUD|nr:hypothetical protein QDA00_gp30 [Microbacterium phage Matzah]QHB37073.1 hypothetical protein SEA_MATZAH_80 [Microbacterium phage Matzah]